MKLTATDPCMPDLLSMSEEEQVFLSALADEIMDILNHAERTMAAKVKDLDMDETLALWSLLEAKYRTAIKRGDK